MSQKVRLFDLQLRARGNVISAIDQTKALPALIFSTTWQQFFFFESDAMFVPRFVDVIGSLVQAEDATIAFLVNLDLARSPDPKRATEIFLSAASSGADYCSTLRLEEQGTAWLDRMDTYACASDIGDWCIYAEKENDIAVLGLRRAFDRQVLQAALDGLNAHSIDQLCELGAEGPFPFHSLTPSWREGLLKNYGENSRPDWA